MHVTITPGRPFSAAMKSLGALVAALIVGLACGSGPVAVTSPTPIASSSPKASQTPPGSPMPTSSTVPSPVAAATCYSFNKLQPGSSLVLLGGGGGSHSYSYIYDVANPTNPRLLCKILNTSAHLQPEPALEWLNPIGSSDTDVNSHRLSDGADRGIHIISAWTNAAAWSPDGTLAVHRVDGAGVHQVLTTSDEQVLFTYPIGIGDCVCRFGLPTPVLAVSPGGRYVVGGWARGEGSQPLAIYSLATRHQVAALAPEDLNAFWDAKIDRLFIVSNDRVKTWTFADGEVPIPGVSPWRYLAGLSPSGTMVSYTDYMGQDQTQPRVFVHDLATSSSRMLTSASRSQAVFVKEGWVWYFEEQTCADCPNSTKPSGKVFAMDLVSGVERPVVFDEGDTPQDLVPGEFWPKS